MLLRLYLASRKHRWLYPVYLALRMPLMFPALAANEGFLGALKWLGCRVRLLLGGEAAFVSAHGFVLSQPIEFAVYDEIFIEGCYKFKNLPALLRGKPTIRVVDFGNHHGLFIDYVLSQNPKAQIYGAEMSPVAYGYAAARFAKHPDVNLRNVAIGGSERKERVTLVDISTTQSLNGAGEVEVEVTTPDQCLRQWNILGQEIDLLKMDIEGAEKEVFENLQSIRQTLATTKAIVMETHGESVTELVIRQLASIGFTLDEQRNTNFLFVRVAR